ncbi:MAG: hypothetical protein Q8O76_14720 [Chloroflexota bacterium]|nr:hypothetical protein [Chloroflexota bacterium]
MPEIVDPFAYYPRQERERIAHATVKTHICGVCQSALCDPHDPELGEVVARCIENPTHQGYQLIRGATKRYRAGEMLSGDVAQAIERKLEKDRKLKEAK